MKNKGFTLIELIVTIVILGIIMLVAAPNITSMIDKNERTSYIQDAQKIVKLAKYKFSQTTLGHPGSGSCLRYKISELDKTELNSAPKGGKYLDDYSYVDVKYEGGEYKFYVQLVEEYTASGRKYYRGVTSTESNNLLKETAKMLYVKNGNNLISFNAANDDCKVISDAERPVWTLEEVATNSGSSEIFRTTGLTISVKATKVTEMLLTPNDVNVYLNGSLVNPSTKTVAKKKGLPNGDQIWQIELNNFPTTGELYISIKGDTYKTVGGIGNAALNNTKITLANGNVVKIK